MGKVEGVLKKASPLAKLVGTFVPPARIVYDGLQGIAKVLHKLLPVIGNKVEKHYTKKLSQKSYTGVFMTEEERRQYIRQQALYDIDKFEFQLNVLITENKESRHIQKNQKLINEKMMKLLATKEMLEKYM
jgi:hypothetical protein